MSRVDTNLNYIPVVCDFKSILFVFTNVDKCVRRKKWKEKNQSNRFVFFSFNSFFAYQ